MCGELFITHHQGNAKQHNREIAPHTSKTGTRQKEEKQTLDKNPSSTVLRVISRSASIENSVEISKANEDLSVKWPSSSTS